jgi:hypothetical protein
MKLILFWINQFPRNKQFRPKDWNLGETPESLSVIMNKPSHNPFCFDFNHFSRRNGPANAFQRPSRIRRFLPWTVRDIVLL